MYKYSVKAATHRATLPAVRPDLQSSPYCDMDVARRHIPMSAMAKRRTAVLALLSANLILFSCSSSDAPQPGTPAFYWAAAKETYAAGDYHKTAEHLGNILSSQNDYVARAQPWMLILTSGMAHGYMDLADAFESGGRANQSQTTGFHRLVNEYRGSASRMSLQFAETFGNFQSKDDYVTLAFPLPTGSS